MIIGRVESLERRGEGRGEGERGGLGVSVPVPVPVIFVVSGRLLRFEI